MKTLTDQQINDIAAECKCGYFEYGDAQGEARVGFARAIEKACHANNVDYPVLRIVDEHLLKKGRLRDERSA